MILSIFMTNTLTTMTTMTTMTHALNHWTEAPSWSTRLHVVWPKYLTLFQLRLAIYLFSFLPALTLLTYLVKIYHFPQKG